MLAKQYIFGTEILYCNVLHMFQKFRLAEDILERHQTTIKLKVQAH
jgi:hypothetical protein